MIVFPNAKINLGLHILSKRDDGFHEIESCLYPIPLTEALEILPSKNLSYEFSGIPIPGQNQDNLVIMAYKILKSDFPDLPPISAHLHKNIPIGAGLGGGSADAAFTLSLINDLFDLKVPNPQLEKYASLLGSDCPFFIENRPKIATGRGEKLAPINLDLKGTWIYLIHPKIHISTKQAYAGVQPKAPTQPIAEILEQKTWWKDKLLNDFEPGIFKDHPEIHDLKNYFYRKGAFYSAMSGSGSAVFGLFETKPLEDKFPDHYLQFSAPMK